MASETQNTLTIADSLEPVLSNDTVSCFWTYLQSHRSQKIYFELSVVWNSRSWNVNKTRKLCPNYILQYKSIANDCVIPRHCKHFHSPIFSNRVIFSVSTLSRAAKPHGAWNKIYVLTRHFITLISYYKLPINHFPLWSYTIFVKISEKNCLTYDFI